MDYELSAEVQVLRTRVRALVEEHVPPEFHGAFTDDPADLAIAQRFCRVLADEKLLTRAWPAEFGGGDGTIWEQTAVREEMWAANEPRGAQYMGVNWVGPVIMRYGTPEQRAEHLTRIGRGEVIWCQGFSEPNAGSDLASLATAAVADGDGWRIHGQKVWTSYASMAQWCFLLARTSHEDAKHRGITVFLLPMDRPGIEVRPLASMLGPHHLNEVFLDGVPVGPADVLGPVGDGWSIVREVLAHERVGIARYARCDRLLNDAPAALGSGWATVPAALRQRWTRALVHTRRARLLAYAVVDLQARGEVDPKDTAAYRVSVTLNDQEVGEVLMELCQSLPVQTTPEQERFRRDAEGHWRYAMAATLASGSVEVQRMLIARAMLGPVRVNLSWADEAVELGKVVESAIRDIGGVEVARRAEVDPSVPASLVGPALESLGLWDIDPAAGAIEIEAATLACRAAGRFGLPYPVAERLARPSSADVDAIAFVDLARPRAGMAEVGLRWLAIDGRGRTAPVTGAHLLATTLGGFVCELEVGPEDDWTEGDGASRRTLAVLLTLSAWTLLGTLEGAVDLTREHVVAREQFGKPLASFQAVQFQLADAFVAVQGLRELARYALASVEADRVEALVDAVALRSCAQETAELVLRTAHQLHGATGFCDETPLSWLSRATHPARYLPFGQADTERWLTELVDAEGFTGLFAAGSR